MKTAILFFAVCLALCLVASRAVAAEALGGEYTVAVAGADVRRGEIVEQTLVLQPSATLHWEPFAVSAWAVFALDKRSEGSFNDRTHLMADHTMQSGRHIFRSGLAATLYLDADRRNRPDNVFEIFGEYALDAFLLPSLGLHYDLSPDGGLYAFGSLRHHWTIVRDKAALEARGGLGWGDRRYMEKEMDLSAPPTPAGPRLAEASLRIALPLRLSDRLYATPSVAYVVMADSATRIARRAEQLHDSMLWARFELRAEF